MSGKRVKSLVGFNRKSASVLSEVPRGWLSSRAVAMRAALSVRTARAMLNRAGVKSVLVRVPGACAGRYWEPEGVQSFLSARPDVITDLPAGWCCSYEAAVLLGVCRSTLCRYESKGELVGRFVRVRTSSGVRMLKVFRRSQVRGLVTRLQNEDRTRRRSIAAKYKKMWGSIHRGRVFVPME